MSTLQLIRKLNASDVYRWRTRTVDGQRVIERREEFNMTRPFWSFQGWADDHRDVARLAEDYGVA